MSNRAPRQALADRIDALSMSISELEKAIVKSEHAAHMAASKWLKDVVRPQGVSTRWQKHVRKSLAAALEREREKRRPLIEKWMRKAEAQRQLLLRLQGNGEAP